MHARRRKRAHRALVRAGLQLSRFALERDLDRARSVLFHLDLDEAVTMAISHDAFLELLDQCIGEPAFPALDNATQLIFAQHLHVLRSDKSWAIVFELGAVMPMAGVVGGTGKFLYRYGSDLVGDVGFTDPDVSPLISVGSDEPFYVDEYDEFVNVTATSIRIRDTEVPISADPAWYASAGITLRDPAHPRQIELLRALGTLHEGLMRVPDHILYRRFTSTPAVILTLRDWHHPDVSVGEQPSESESLRMIASVIESGDPAHYIAPQRPNAHWKNWPVAGCNTSWDSLVSA